MDWNKIKAALKLDKDLTDESAEGILLDAISTRDKQIGELSGKVESITKQVSELKLSHEKQVTELKLSHEPKKPDKQLVKLAGELRESKLDALVSAGHVTPAAAKELKSVFAQGEGLELSLARDDETFDKVMAALKLNKALQLGEHSGPQVLELSNNGAGAGDGAKALLENARQMAERSKNFEW